MDSLNSHFSRCSDEVFWTDPERVKVAYLLNCTNRAVASKGVTCRGSSADSLCFHEAKCAAFPLGYEPNSTGRRHEAVLIHAERGTVLWDVLWHYSSWTRVELNPRTSRRPIHFRIQQRRLVLFRLTASFKRHIAAMVHNATFFYYT